MMWWLMAGISLLALIAVTLILRASRVEVVTLRPPLPPGSDVEALVRAGHKIEAIRRYRELHPGVGLKDAKDAVEGLERGEAAPVVPGTREVERHMLLGGHRHAEPVLSVSDAAIEHEIRSGNLINAIKLYREKTGVGLREAKDAVEAWQHRLRSS